MDESVTTHNMPLPSGSIEGEHEDSGPKGLFKSSSEVVVTEDPVASNHLKNSFF